jgi:hypothetical protein
MSFPTPYVARRPLMTAIYTNAAAVERSVSFLEADQHYASIKAELTSAEWCDLNHAELERRLRPEADNLMRLLLQEHYTLRGRASPVGAVVGEDGAARTHVREETGRSVKTIFGRVWAERTAYSGRGLTALHPTDADLNLPNGVYSHEVKRQVVLGAIQESFDETVNLVGRTTSAGIGKRQAEDLVHSAAVDFGEFYEQRDFKPETAEETGPVLVLSFDQKGVVLRKEDLRDATRKAAEEKARKLETRYCKGEPHGRKRMSTVGTVYTSQPHVRTPLDVIKGLRRIRDATAKPKPPAELKRVWASLEDSPLDVIRAGFKEALKRDPGQMKKWYVAIDGDEDLETWVSSVAKEFGVEVTIVLDVIHALGYLWKAGKAFHKEATPELEGWVLERLQSILEGKVSDVAAGMRRSATLRALGPKARKPVDKCANYFLKRTHLMRYHEYLAAGGPISSGAVEGTCRHLICDRFDITGAVWSLLGAEAVLRLRAIKCSGDFNEYWRFHEDQERQRNHNSRYANEAPPPVKLLPHRQPRLRAVKG